MNRYGAAKVKTTIHRHSSSALVFLALSNLITGAAGMSPRRAWLSLDLDRQPALGQPLPLTIKLRTATAVADGTLILDIAESYPGTRNTFTLWQGQTHSPIDSVFEWTLEPVVTGSYHARAIFKRGSASDSPNELVANLFLEATTDGIWWSRSSRRQALLRMARARHLDLTETPTNEAIDNSVDTLLTLPSITRFGAADPSSITYRNPIGSQNRPMDVLVASEIYIHGSCTYADEYGDEHPIRHAHVEIWDEDGFLNPDDHLGNTSTDSRGNYSRLVDNTEENGVDLYIKVFTRNSIMILGADDPVSESIYRVRSRPTLVDWRNNDAQIDLVVPFQDAESSAFNVFDIIVDAWKTTQRLFGVELPLVYVEFPAWTTAYNPPLDYILLESKYFSYPYPAWHEFGHFLADKRGFAENGPICIFQWPPGGCVHDFETDWRDYTSSDTVAKQGAMREAWATFYSYILSAESDFDDIGEEDCPLFCDVAETLGDSVFSAHKEFFEGPIIAALWDLYDTGSSAEPIDNVERPIQEIVFTFDDNSVQAIDEFYYEYVHTYREHRRDVSDIFLYNGMGFLPQWPSNPDPSDNSQKEPLQLTMCWDHSANAAFYGVLFSNQPNLDDSDWQEDVVYPCWWNSPQLREATTYYWQIIAYDARGGAAWSPTWSFTTIADRDGDGIPDHEDNCVCVANASQCDADRDGFGNQCDPDLNGDGVVGIPDFNAFRSCFGKREGDPEFEPACDFDCDGTVGISDFDVLRRFFGREPGGNACLQDPTKVERGKTAKRDER